MKSLRVLASAGVAAAGFASTGAGAPVRVTYWDPAWSPTGREIAFADRGDVAGDLYVVEADGTAVRRLTNSSYASGNYGARLPTWSPDGRRIAFGYGSDGIAVVKADGTGLRRMIATGDQPAWSPSGRWIAYTLGEDQGGRISVAKPDGSHRRIVARPPENDSYQGPTWSPDGRRLAFGVGTAPDSSLVTPYLAIVGWHGGRMRRFAVGHTIWSADWSPNGRTILLSEDPIVNDRRGLRGVRISVLNLRSKRLRPLRPGLGARWSPSGREIVFSNGRDIYVMSADGSHVRQLTHAPPPLP